MENDKKDLAEIQNEVNGKIENILKENSDFKKYQIKEFIKSNPLDTQALYEKCPELYKPGDTKKDLAKKLLNNIKDNKNKFKAFSKIAEEILNEGWCDNLDDF